MNLRTGRRASGSALSAPTHAGGLFVGTPTNVQSNVNASGAITGYQIGSQIPGVLESLQEGPRATYTPSLYYDETLGQINQPSFQKTFGTYDRTIENVGRFGDTGIFHIPNDIFWNGPAAVRMNVQLNPNFMGLLHNTHSAIPPHYKPAIFYSWGAGYAAILRWTTNLGGAAQYTLDRYANWVGVMASCESTYQRACLMKLAGGGVIAETPTFESAWGLSGATANYSDKFPTPLPWNLAYGFPTSYDGVNQLLPTSAFMPVSDNWVICLRTPHTNFNNPRVRRRPLDTKLFSQQFTVDVVTAQMHEFTDTSTGNPVFYGACLEKDDNPIVSTAQQIRNTLDAYKGLIYPINAASGEPPQGFQEDTLHDRGGLRAFPEYYRQYERGVVGNADIPLPLAFSTNTDAAKVAEETGIFLSNFNSRYACQMNHLVQTCNISTPIPASYPVTPNAAILTNILTPIVDVLPKRDAQDYQIEMKTIISSLRLTNDMLGAYSAIASRTDLAVYYPFQHLTSQIYSVPNQKYGNMTMYDVLAGTVRGSDGGLGSTGKIDFAYTCQVPINIPVNPMTAMYICVFREKDRASRGIGVPGAYTPALFWNALQLTYLDVSYGAQPLVRYESHAEYMCEQAYEHTSSIQVPYKGGFTTRGEFDNSTKMNAFGNSRFVAENGGGELYHGAIRDASIYEISLVEMEPMRNEAFFQNTPSFQGEQLNVTFQIQPFTFAGAGSGRGYSPYSDKSYVDDYTAINGAGFKCEPLNLWVASGATDATSGSDDPSTINFYNNGRSIAPDLLGPPGAKSPITGRTMLANAWVLNNDANLMMAVVFAQNALWQLNPNASKLVFARG